MVSDFSLFFSCGKDVICFSFLEKMTGETAWMVAFKNSGGLLRVKCAVVEREVYQKVTKACVTSVNSNWRNREDVFVVRGGLCLVPRPHYYARPMRFGSRGPRKFSSPRQTRRSETFCLTWGGAFGIGRAVNNFSALIKDVQQPWKVQKIKR